ncbi:MAG: thioredoxin family protein [Gammaproteobacteria bacterium]
MSEKTATKSSPRAQMLLGPHCPHCAAVLNSLSELVKQGVISQLEVVNLEQRPEIARELGVRSVPWVKIGQFELAGLHSQAELKSWAEQAGSEQGMTKYIEQLLGEGEVERVLEMIGKDPDLLHALTGLVSDADAKINARLGVGVIMEEYEGKQALLALVPELAELTKHEDARVRSDACHYLSLTKAASVRQFIEPLLDDDHAEVREVAAESLAALNHAN